MPVTNAPATSLAGENTPPATPALTNFPAASATADTNALPSVTRHAEEVIAAGTINFPATDLNQVLQIYSELVNRTVLRPANLPAPLITLKTQTPLTKKEAIQAFDAVLAMNGITMINIGDKFVKAVPTAQANQEGAPFNKLDSVQLPEVGQYVTHLVQLRYVKPSELVPVLQSFAKIPGSILPIDSSQILVLRDNTENVKRMLEIIKEIDIFVPSEFISEVIPIKYAKANEIADALNSLSGGGGGGGGTSIGRSANTGATRQGTTGMTRPGAGGYGGAGGTQFGGQTTPGATPGQPGAPGGSFTERLRNIIKGATTSGDLQILGQTKIIADERSNSLLIFAGRADMDMIKNVVSKLDVVLAQVLIETVILDVQLDNGWNYGISAGQQPKTTGAFQTAGTVNSQDVAGNTPLSTLSQLFGNVASGTNLAGGLPVASGLSYFGRYKGGVDLALQAAASDSRVNVVQTPQILTTHATPGQIFVGSTVPYVTTSYYGNGLGSSGGNSYQQLQVGIGLQVTPYINQDGLVVMEIEESIDEISGSIAIQNVGNVPTTTSRKLSAQVAVRDGDTIILGGFIRNSDSKSSSGIPLLKDIPILGNLFSSKSDSKSRKELLVLMRPTVLKTPEIAALKTAEEKRRLPGVRSAEAEVQADVKKQMDIEDKEMLKRQTPPKPDEQKAYGTPPSSTPSP